MIHGNRRIMRTAVATLLGAGLLAFLPASPASASHAAPRNIDSACPAGIPDHGFSDVPNPPPSDTSPGADTARETSRAVSCIKALGITGGTTATTYGGSGNVSRAQMASFLMRKLDKVFGFTRVANAPETFTDISNTGAHLQNIKDGAANNPPVFAGVVGDQCNDIAGQDPETPGGGSPDYCPTQDVSRAQMATFVVNQLKAAGVTLPTPSDPNPFTDVPAGAPHAENIAIVHELGIFVGSGGLFRPSDPISRGQMALVLARDFDVIVDAGRAAPAGTATGGVTVTPDTAVTQADGTARSFSATYRNTDGTNYAGQTIIQLFNANANGTPNTGSLATCAFIQQVDGTIFVGPTNNVQTTFVGTDGAVSFIVRDNNGGPTCNVIPRVVADADTDGVVDAGEQRDDGGQTTFPFVPAEQANGNTSTQIICSVVRTAGSESFVGDNANGCGGAAPDDLRHDVDSNDIFLGSQAANFAAFVQQMSPGDSVAVSNYQRAPEGQSTFNLTNNVQPLTVTPPTTPQDANNVTLTGTGESGFTVTVYQDINPDGDAVTDNDYQNGTDVPLASGVVNDSGTWSIQVPLAQNATNNFVAVQRPAGQNDSTAVPPANLVRDTEGEVVVVEAATATRPIITAVNGVQGGPSTAGTLGPGDTIVGTTNEDMNWAANASLTLLDPDNSSTVLTRGADFTLALADGPDANATAGDAFTLTITSNPATNPAGTTGGIQSPATITAAGGITAVTDSAALNVGASTDKVIDTF